MTLTMREIEQAAEQYVQELYREHGITRPVPSARPFPAVRDRGRVREYLAQKKRGGDRWRGA